MKNFVKYGNTLTFTATADRVSGEGFLLGPDGLFGVSSHDTLTGADGEVVVAGVFKLPKTAANAPAQFAAAYWDNATKEVTTTVGSNTKIGYFAKAYIAATTEAEVKLTP